MGAYVHMCVCAYVCGRRLTKKTDENNNKGERNVYTSVICFRVRFFHLSEILPFFLR